MRPLCPFVVLEWGAVGAQGPFLVARAWRRVLMRGGLPLLLFVVFLILSYSY